MILWATSLAPLCVSFHRRAAALRTRRASSDAPTASTLASSEATGCLPNRGPRSRPMPLSVVYNLLVRSYNQVDAPSLSPWCAGLGRCYDEQVPNSRVYFIIWTMCLAASAVACCTNVRDRCSPSRALASLILSRALACCGPQLAPPAHAPSSSPQLAASAEVALTRPLVSSSSAASRWGTRSCLGTPTSGSSTSPSSSRRGRSRRTSSRSACQLRRLLLRGLLLRGLLQLLLRRIVGGTRSLWGICCRKRSSGTRSRSCRPRCGSS